MYKGSILGGVALVTLAATNLQFAAPVSAAKSQQVSQSELLPSAGIIVYEGSASTTISKRPKANQKLKIGNIFGKGTDGKTYDGNITMSMEISGNNVVVTMTGTNGYGGQLMGTVSGGKCRLIDLRETQIWEGQCDRNGFSGKVSNTDQGRDLMSGHFESRTTDVTGLPAPGSPSTSVANSVVTLYPDFVGTVDYSGGYNGTEGRNSSFDKKYRTRQIAGQVRLLMKFDSDRVEATYAGPAVDMGVEGVEGTRIGDQCDMSSKYDGIRITGRCDSTGFVGKITRKGGISDLDLSVRLTVDKMTGYTGRKFTPEQIAAQQASAPTVTVSVPGMKTAIEGKVGVPLVARWPVEAHNIIDLEGVTETSFLTESKSTRDEWGAGTLNMAGSDFLPIRKYRSAGLFEPTGRNERIGGVYVTEGGPNWPASLADRVVIWAIDGYAFASSGSADRQMALYMSRRKKSEFAYVEYFIVSAESGAGYGGHQMQVLRDSKGRPYSQGMIIPLEAFSSPSISVVGHTAMPNDQAAMFSRMFGLGVASMIVGDIVGDLSQPIADRLRDDYQRCIKEDIPGVVC